MAELIAYLAQLPVEWFTLAGAFIEELISPIPSFVVFVPAGASLAAHGTSMWYMLVLALIAALGRILAAAILYWLSGKLRRFIFAKKGSWFGIDKNDIENLRKKLHGRWSWWMIFAMWAIPVFPGAPISLTCGFVKVPFWPFITATYVGSIFNALFYMYVGYYGLKAATTMNAFDFISDIIAACLVVIVVAWIVRRHYMAVLARKRA